MADRSSLQCSAQLKSVVKFHQGGRRHRVLKEKLKSLNLLVYVSHYKTSTIALYLIFTALIRELTCIRGLHYLKSGKL